MIDPNSLGLGALEDQYDLPHGLLQAVGQQESGWNPKAVSSAGAQGLFQFMPPTAKQYGIDPNDPQQAAQGAAQMYSDLLKKYNGDVKSALAAYNWGQGNVDRKGIAAAPPETQRYVQNITSRIGYKPQNTRYASQAQPQSSGFDDFMNSVGNMLIPSANAAEMDNNEPSDEELTQAISSFSAPQQHDEISDEDLTSIITGRHAGLNPLQSATQGLAKGTVSLLTGPVDLGAHAGTWLANKAGRVLGGPDYPQENYPPSLTQNAFDALGINKKPADVGSEYAQTVGEFLPAAAGSLEGNLGNLVQVGGKLLGRGVAPAVTSETAGQYTKGTEWEPWARLAGALLPTALMPAVNAANSAVQPLTQGGRQQIVGNALNQFADDPALAARNMNNAAEFVPGSQPMAGEASGDYGLLGLQKGLRNLNPSEFANRISEQNAGRNRLLDGMAGTPEDIQALQASRDAGTAQMREQSFQEAQYSRRAQAAAQKVPTLEDNLTDLGSQRSEAQKSLAALNNQMTVLKARQVNSSVYAPNRNDETALQKLIDKKQDAIDNLDDNISNVRQNLDQQRTAASSYNGQAAGSANITGIKSLINRISSSPSGNQQTVENAMKWVKDRIGNESNPENLYEIRKDINYAMQGKYSSNNLPDYRLAKGQLKQVKNALDDAIDEAASGYKDYIASYREQSKPINQMQSLQDIKARVALSAPDPVTGYDFISQPKWSQRVQANEAELSKTLTPEQMDNLKSITKDLDRGSAVNNSAIRAPGSDTMQNLSSANLLGSVLGKKLSSNAFVRTLGAPFKWLYTYANKDVNKLMVDAMMDPKLAAKLMQKATPTNLASIASAMKRNAVVSGIGVNSGDADAKERFKNIPHITITPSRVKSPGFYNP